MSKRGVIRCILSIVMAAYLAVALAYAYKQDKIEPYRRLDISVNHAEGSTFVNADAINLQLDNLRDTISQISAENINTLEIERKVLEMDNVENVNCVVLNNRTLKIDVVPLIPVARVFDIGSGTDFYINAQGKRMRSRATSRIDVPVVIGDFSWKSEPVSVLPIIEYLKKNPDMGAAVSAIKVSRKGDIYLVPMIKGHVVCFGDNSNVEDKMKRLMTFYRKVLPVKGWEYYDTISVKWNGQIVANRFNKHVPVVNMPEADEIDDDNLSTMSTSTNPGQPNNQ